MWSWCVSLAFVAAGSASVNASTEEIAGFGRTVEEAKLDARMYALKRLMAKLEAKSPPRTAWRPTLADLDSFIQGPGRLGNATHWEPLGLVHQWILTVQFPSDGEIERRDRQAWRQRAAAFLVAAMIAGCGVWLAAAAWRRSTAGGGGGWAESSRPTKRC